MTDPIQDAVDEFVSKLRGLIRAEAIKAVQDVLGNEAPKTPAPKAEPEAPPPAKKAAPKAPQPAPKPQAAPKVKKATKSKRVRRSADQIEATSRKIVEYVRANPGLGAEAIKKALGIPKAEWGRPLAMALASGGIRSKGERRGTVYQGGGK